MDGEELLLFIPMLVLPPAAAAVTWTIFDEELLLSQIPMAVVPPWPFASDSVKIELDRSLRIPQFISVAFWAIDCTRSMVGVDKSLYIP